MGFLILIFLIASNITSIRGIELQAPAFNVELLGRWPYGECNAVVVDSAKNVAWIGNGYAFQVLDISTPSALSVIGEMELEGIVQDMAVSGNYAYVVTQSFLKIVDISDLNNPNEIGSVYDVDGSLKSIALSSGYAYVAAAGAGLKIYDVSDPSNPTFKARYDVNFVTVHDVGIWGNYAICECEYWKFPELPNNIFKIEVIDISDPLAPGLIGSYETAEGYYLQGIDVSGAGYVFTCQYSYDDNTSKMAVIDVATNPANPVEVGSYVESETRFRGIALSGNYAFLGDYEKGRLVALNISTFSSPSYLGEASAYGDFFEICISGNLLGTADGSNGFSLFDVSDPSNPSKLGDHDTPGRGFCGNPILVSGDYAYMASRDDGLRIMDISDPSNPTQAGICENVSAFGGIAISGRFVYCLGHPYLYIVDISSPNSPIRAQHLEFPSDTVGTYELNDVAVRGNYAYVTGNKWGANERWGFLSTVDISNPLNPSIMGTYVCSVPSAHYGGIALSGNYAYMQFEETPYVDVRRASLRAIDISDPSNPTEVGYYFSSDENTVATDSEGRYSYTVKNGWSGAVIPSKSGYIFSPSSQSYSNVTSDQVDQDYIAATGTTNIASQAAGISGNLSINASPTISGTVKTGAGTGIAGVTIKFADNDWDFSSDLVVRGDFAYLVGCRFIIIDISDPKNPVEISSLSDGGNVVALSGDYAYLGNLRIIDISDPYNPAYAGYYYGEGGIGVAVSGNHAYVSGSLSILKNLLAPEVSITNPSPWSNHSGPVSIEVQASHSSGINRVEFFIDDELQFTDNTSAYGYTWDSTTATNGPHKIRARAYNNNGKSSDYELEVTVSNQLSLSILSNPGGTTDPEPGTYNYGGVTQISVAALADPGYIFTGWSGDVSSGHENDNPLILTLDTSKSITANFAQLTVPFIYLSPSALNFGATTTGTITTNQYFKILNPGGDVLDWAVSDDADWLSCTPSSGSGDAQIKVSADPTGLSIGTHDAAVTITSASAVNSPQLLNVVLNVYPGGNDSKPFGFFDTPPSGATVSGNIPVTGWALDDIEVTRVELKRSSHPDDPSGAIGPDGLVFIWNAYFVPGARPDLEAAYPHYPLCDRAGWGCMMLTNFLPNSGNGTYTLYAFAYDGNGHKTELGQKVIHADNANRTKPFGAIDAPSLGQVLSGPQFTHFAWALTPQPKMIPTDGSTIWVFINGVPIGHPTYNQYRSDIATLFPGYANSSGAVGFYHIDLTKYANGIHMLQWSVTDDQSAVDGMSRYFEVQNLGGGVTSSGNRQLVSLLEDQTGSLGITARLKERGYSNKANIGDRTKTSDASQDFGHNQRPLIIDIEQLERIVIELKSESGSRFIGWGFDETRGMPIGSTLDQANGLFYWSPGPGFLGEHVLHFVVTDGEFRSKPVKVVVNIVPK